MSAKDYMKFNPKNNMVYIDLNNYTGEAFVEGIKIRDIAHVKILKREDMKGKEHGSPDVMLMRASGETVFITRQELIKNYQYLSGKKIVIPYMKNNVVYKVIGRCEQPYAVMLLPANMVGTYKGKTVNPGTYVVAPKLADGSIDYANLTPINRSLFRKMFKIPNQEVIARHAGNPGKVSNRIRTRKSNRKKFGLEGRLAANNPFAGQYKENNPWSSFNSTPSGSDSLGADINYDSVQVPTNENTAPPAQKKTFPYRATGVVITQEDRTEVGYMIEDTKGKVHSVPKRQVMDLCAKNLISNLTLVTQSNGTAYIRGNGISVEQLPRFYA